MLDLNDATYSTNKNNSKVNKKCVTPVTFRQGKGFEDTSPSQVRHKSVTKPSIKPDSLIKEISSKDGKKQILVIESKASDIVGAALNGFFAFDPDGVTWYEFSGTYWRARDNHNSLNSALVSLLKEGAGNVGYKPSYRSGIKSEIEAGGILPLPKTESGKLPFANGLLDLKTKELEKITPKNAMTWCLPYSYKKGADCPNIKDWLLKAVDNDEDTVELLRAFMAAVLHGRNDLQKFLHLKGAGGTGKGTLMRLLEELVGRLNTVSTSLQHLEQNRFETARLYSKRLAVITDSDKYGGSVNVLKAITGKDPIRLERKHQQQSGDFMFEGMVVIASNESLQLTDHTNSIDRRRITVIFDRRATNEEKQDWEKRGGEEVVLHSELPGLVNWLLGLSQEKISSTIRNPPKRVNDADLEAMRATNPISDWVLECCVLDNNAWTQIGDCREYKSLEYETVYKNADKWLYANYCQWMRRNQKRPLANNKFSEILVQTCETLGSKVERHREPGTGKRGIRGIELKPDSNNGL